MTETYLLKLAIDDSQIKALEQRLGGIMGVKGGNSNNNNTEVAKNITKLGAIAVGVGGILGLVKKITEMTTNASPMLQAMLKLFDTSVTLILRPIGDFIGFALRPIMMYFLMYVALPFYRYFAPFMQKYGNALGQIFASPAGFVTLIAAGVAVGLAALGKTFSEISKLVSNIMNPQKPPTPSPSSKSGSSASTKSGTFDPTIDEVKIVGRNPNTNPVQSAKDLAKTLTDPGSIDPTMDQRLARAKALAKSGLAKPGNFNAQTGQQMRPIGGKATTSTSVLQDIAARLKIDKGYIADMLKYAPKILKGALKYAPEISGIVALMTGDASWIIPGWGGEAGGGEAGGLASQINQSMPTITSRFTGNSQLNPLPKGFTQGSAVSSVGSPTFTLNINAGTIVDKQGLADMINSQVKSQVPSLVQNSIKRTNIK